MTKYLTKTDIKKLLCIKKNETLHKFLRIKDMLVTDEFYSREKIMNLLGAKPDNTEQFILIKEAAEILDCKISTAAVKALRGTIPSYKMYNLKGSAYLFLRSELEALNNDKFFIEWNRSFSEKYLRNKYIKNILHSITIEDVTGLSDMEKIVFNKIIHENRSTTQAAAEMGICKGAVEYHLRNSARKIGGRINKRMKYLQELTHAQNITMPILSEIIKQKDLEIANLKKQILSETIELPKQPINYPLLAQPIEYLQIHPRIIKMITSSEIQTIGDIIKHPKEHYKKYQGMGEKAYNQLTTAIQELNLEFINEEL